MGANDKLAATFHPAPAFGQLVVGVTGPWPINGPAHQITPEAHRILVRLGWTPPPEIMCQDCWQPSPCECEDQK